VRVKSRARRSSSPLGPASLIRPTVITGGSCPYYSIQYIALCSSSSPQAHAVPDVAQFVSTICYSPYFTFLCTLYYSATVKFRTNLGHPQGGNQFNSITPPEDKRSLCEPCERARAIKQTLDTLISTDFWLVPECREGGSLDIRGR
jgi:hypothetical protein